GLEGAATQPRDGVDDRELLELAGLLDGVEPSGDPAVQLARRAWDEPSVTVIGFDAPGVAGASNTIQPGCRARFSVRLPPEADPHAAWRAIEAHLRAHAPAGLRATFEPVSLQRGWRSASSEPVGDVAAGALADAFGAPCRRIGLGGTVPFVHAFLEALEQPELVLLGVGDPRSNAHGIDESVAVDDLRRMAVAEALFLARVGQAVTMARQER